MRLRSLSLFVVLHTVSDRSRYCDIEAIINVDLLCAVTAALIRSMNNDFSISSCMISGVSSVIRSYFCTTLMNAVISADFCSAVSI